MAILRKLSKLVRLLGVPRYRNALLRGTAAAVEHEQMVKALDVRSFIDVGANKGQFSLLVRQHHPDAWIYAVEPLNEAADIYAGLFENDDNVTLFRCAAGAEQDVLEINIAGRADSSSLLSITSAQDAAFPGTAQVGTRTVPVERIDTLVDFHTIAAPLLIKLDVQGYEIEALRGMSSLMAMADYIYLEISFDTLYAGQPLAADVIDWLSQNEFNLDVINGVTRSATGVPVQADALFTRRANRGR